MFRMGTIVSYIFYKFYKYSKTSLLRILRDQPLFYYWRKICTARMKILRTKIDGQTVWANANDVERDRGGKE